MPVDQIKFVTKQVSWILCAFNDLTSHNIRSCRPHYIAEVCKDYTSMNLNAMFFSLETQLMALAVNIDVRIEHSKLHCVCFFNM